MARPQEIVREGLVVGLTGYASVAVLYAALDLVAGRGALFTVDLLGKSLFQGLRDPAVLTGPITVDFGAVAVYNAFHLVAALAIGIFVTFLVDRAERRPEGAPAYLVVVVLGFVATVVVVGRLTTGIRPVLPWWSIVVANGIAVLAAGLYLLRKRPGAWRLLSPFGDQTRRASLYR